MHVIIFANGPVEDSPLPLPEHDLLIAADGGAARAFRFDLIPDLVIGDLDSLSPSEVAGYDRSGAGIIRHPAGKDETDLELALQFAQEEGADRITLYGLTGGRWDMTFANILLLASQRFAGIRLTAVHGATRMHILRGGERLDLTGEPGQRISVLPLAGPLSGLSYQGLSWPLEDESLPFGSPRGVSNTFSHSEAGIRLKSGVALIVHETGPPS